MRAVACTLRPDGRLCTSDGSRRSIRPADIVLLAHSLVGRDFAARPFRAIRVVRDPRDIWVSGYLYHRHCQEEWCTNTNFDACAADHLSTRRLFLRALPGKLEARLSGQARRQVLSGAIFSNATGEAGLAFELAGYTGCTLDAMRGWTLATPDLLQVQLEDVMCDFDGALGRSSSMSASATDECAQAVELARPHDVARMSDEAVARNRHIHSRTISKWRDFLSAAEIDEFERRYGESDRRSGLSAQPISGA